MASGWSGMASALIRRGRRVKPMREDGSEEKVTKVTVLRDRGAGVTFAVSRRRRVERKGGLISRCIKPKGAVAGHVIHLKV